MGLAEALMLIVIALLIGVKGRADTGLRGRERRQPPTTAGIDSPRSITPPPKEAPDDG